MRRGRAAVLAATVILAVTPAGAAHAGEAPDPPTPQWLQRASAEAQFWTASRLSSAVPVASPAVTGPTSLQLRQTAPKTVPQGRYFGGVPTVGTFFVQQASGATSCTGSVVHSSGHNLLLTAGHCAASWGSKPSHRIFVPEYASGKAATAQPYGFFPVDQMFIDPRFDARQRAAATTDLDFAFAVTGPDSSGRLIEDVTGALTLKTTPGYVNTVTVIGYPGIAHNPKSQALTCTVPTSQLSGYRQMKMLCGGYYSGTSGGPWIQNFNAKTGTGDVIGEIGGRGGGGDDDNDDWVSYSPYFNQNIIDLYDDTVAGKLTARTPYQSVTGPDALPGGVSTWKKARLTASGDYNGPGLLVVWTDGRVSLFPSDRKGGFGAEHTLLAANARWRTARLVTSGDFDGSSLFDLMVVWGNGSVSSFPDVSAKGLGKEKTFAKAGSMWRSATQIAAGRFSTSAYVTDLIVRWSDGEVSLYTGVGGGSFGTEHQLHKPGSLWKNATLLTSGQYTGTKNWDLFVRWADGELDSYPGTNAHGFGAEKRLRNSNSLWRGGLAVATGRFTANALFDDLIVRWPDGTASMFPDTRQSKLGAERVLVQPDPLS
jgi:V8-like Glu-specific endopeptidase